MTVNWYRPDSYFKGWKGMLHLGGDIILNQIIHHIDILRFIFGEVESVFAYTMNTRPKKLRTVDVCVATLRFKSGLLATLDATTNCYPENDRTELTVITDKGVKRIEPIGTSHEHQIRHVVDCIREGKQPEVTGADALKSLEVAVALHRSAFTGKEIRL
jgi:predicted dehydrogenase